MVIGVRHGMRTPGVHKLERIDRAIELSLPGTGAERELDEGAKQEKDEDSRASHDEHSLGVHGGNNRKIWPRKLRKRFTLTHQK